MFQMLFATTVKEISLAFHVLGFMIIGNALSLLHVLKLYT